MVSIRFMVCALLLALFAPSAHAELRTVPFVDVGRYLGDWYQVAHNPLFFEGNCFCSRQELTLKPNGNVGVFNSCHDKAINGPLASISGEATNDDPKSNARFTVDLGLPQKGQYWVIGLDADYHYAVVSDPSLKSLYILSKTPDLDANLYAAALKTAAEQVDISKLVTTVQHGCTYP